MRQPRSARRGRLRYVTKRLYLLVRLLRARPLHQCIALCAVMVVPLSLLLYRLASKASHHSSALGASSLPGVPGAGTLSQHLAPAPSGEARIAYFVQVGLDAVPRLPRLFRAMHHTDNVYAVHLDAKIPATLRAAVANSVAADPDLRRNVHFLPAEMVTYKGVSMVLNTLAGMTLLMRVDDRWEYFINLSGADYPLLSPTNQRRLLARPGVALGRLNFLTFFPRREWRPYDFRIRYMHWDPAVSGLQAAHARLRVFRGMKSYPLERLRRFTFTKAEAWMILSRPFVRFVLRSTFAKRMLLNHVHVRSAPEHYFADVLYNHPVWRRTLAPNAMRKVVWMHRGRRSGQHPYVLDGDSRDPFAFWGYLEGTRSLFARKFSAPDAPITKRIDRLLSGSMVGTEDEEGSPAAEKARRSQQAFYGRICEHFDGLTQKTLRAQGVSWPRKAYPEARAAAG